MGFVVQRNIYRLRFEDPAMAGAVVRVRSVDLGVFINSVKLAGLASALKEGEVDFSTLADMTEDLEEIAGLFRTFADALVDWNLEEEDGTPIPATYEGVCSLEPDFGMAVINAWFDAQGGVSGPLPQSSRSGASAPAVSLPMEPLSSSRAS